MKWFHRHGPWDIVAAFCDRHTHYASGVNGVHGDYFVTNVAFRCRECGMVKCKSLTGMFTLEQLRGDDTQIRGAIKYLES